MMGEESSTDGDQLCGIGREVREAVRGLHDEAGVVPRVAGEGPESLEREHRLLTPGLAWGLLRETEHPLADDVAHHLVGASRDPHSRDPEHEL